MREFSIIIPTFRRRESLSTCLRALSGQTLASDLFEVIVADDEGSAVTRALTEAMLPGVVYVHGPG
jgi:glycosyltransferase involved in cell wall biosynthesis